MPVAITRAAAPMPVARGPPANSIARAYANSKVPSEPDHELDDADLHGYEPSYRVSSALMSAIIGVFRRRWQQVPVAWVPPAAEAMVARPAALALVAFAFVKARLGHFCLSDSIHRPSPWCRRRSQLKLARLPFNLRHNSSRLILPHDEDLLAVAIRSVIAIRLAAADLIEKSPHRPCQLPRYL
jgi:hypothetical protein